MSYRIIQGCIGCTRCVAVCPVLAITGAVKQPHIINELRCAECGVCARACPKSCIIDQHGNVPQSVPRKQWPIPVVNTSLCSACGICVEACGMKALDISKPQYHGDFHVFAMLKEEKKCVGCGLCAENCPLNAVKMEVC